MIELLAYVTALGGYGVLVWALVICRFPTISPANFFVLVYLMQYGPHTLVRQWRDVSAAVTNDVELNFVLAIALVNLTLAITLLIVRMIYPRRFTMKLSMNDPRTAFIRSPAVATTILIVSAATCALFYVIELAGPNRLATILSYYAGNTHFSYEQIRRELFANTPIERVMVYTRFTVSILLVLLNTFIFLRFKGLRLPALVMMLSIFVFTMIQLNKLPMLFCLAGISILAFLFIKQRLQLKRKEIIIVTVAVPFLLGALFLLYVVQYRDALELGYVDYDDLFQLVFYRGFFAQADALRLWFNEFPERTDYLGVANYGNFALLLGVDYFNVTSYIPTEYTGQKTTYQVGFIGSGYAGFGWVGILLFATVAIIIVTAATYLLEQVKMQDVRASLCIALSLDTFFLCSSEFTTALISGGLVPLILICLFVIIAQRKGTRLNPNVTRHHIEIPMKT